MAHVAMPEEPPGEVLGRGLNSEILGWRPERVIKLRSAGAPSTAEDEARATRLARAAGLPAPQVYELVDVGERHGLVLERLEGPTLLAMLARRPWRIAQASRQFASLHAAFASTSGAGLPLQRLKLEAAIGGASGSSDGLTREARARLEGLPDGDAICHMDFHPENVVLAPRGPVVIDWERAASGHPLGDFVHTLLMLRVAEPRKRLQRLLAKGLRHTFLEVYVGGYLETTGYSAQDARAWILPVAAAACTTFPAHDAAIARAIAAAGERERASAVGLA